MMLSADFTGIKKIKWKMPPYPNTDKRRKALTCNCQRLFFVLLKIVPCLSFFFFFFLFAVFPRWLTSSRWSWISLFQTLSETYWSEQYMLTLCLLWETHCRRSCCWCSGWNVEGMCGLKPWWEQQTRLPHETRYREPQRSVSAVE